MPSAIAHFGCTILNRRWLATLGSVLWLLVASANAQSPQLGDLTAEAYEALRAASESRVQATVSFLACDELAGRDTPSPELTIASAYVASRLRAAGAEALGPEGSFYLESEIATTLTPSHGLRLTVAGQPPSDRYTLLTAGDEPVELTGHPFVASADRPVPGEPLSDDSSRIFVTKSELLGSDGGDPVAELRTRGRRLQSLGVNAVVIELDASDPWWELADRHQRQPRIENRRSQFPLPVVLVESVKSDANASAVEWEEMELTIPPNISTTSTVRNVAGVIHGSDPDWANEAIIYSAHLDHIGESVGLEDSIYNGADDDASGVTAVLTLADTFGNLETPTKRSLIFMTFWGEERGLLGSRKLVEDSPWPLEAVVANVNIEMIGRPEQGAENRMWMTGWQQSDLGELVARGSRRMGVETFEHPSYSARLYRASDNYSFVERGVIAHSFSAGSLHEDYHQPSDQWERLHLQHMTQIIRGIFAGTLPIAQAEMTPTKTE